MQHHCKAFRFESSNVNYLSSCAEDTKHLKIAMLQEAVKDEIQFAAPGPAVLAQVSSWTMRPPKETARRKPACIGVILMGSFYVYQAEERYIEDVNEKLCMRLKALISTCMCLA